MATGGEGQLTNNQIVRLARCISSRDMESIALGYLGIEDPIIKNTKLENRDNMEAFNREIIRHWMHRNPEPNQVQVLMSKLLKAAEECGYVDPCKVEKILVDCETLPAGTVNTLSVNKNQMTEDDMKILAETMKPYTEQSMQIERAAWLPEDLVDMDDLFTDISVKQLCNKPKGPKGIKINHYRDLFDRDKLKETRTESCCKLQINENRTTLRKKKSKKLIFEGWPGMGKTTLAKKIALDWARGVFTTFSIVLFVFLKLVSPDDAIENVVIKQNSWLEGLGVTQDKLKEILDTFGDKCLLILDGLDEHGLGTNKDVLKIIKGQKLLNCNVVLTSRPHNITAIKKYFDVIASVEGFTEEQARQFASKILSDENQIDAVMCFDPYRNNIAVQSLSSVYNCPILLSFLCILVQDNQIDLNSPNLSFGNVYSRMIRCLYMKYVRKQDAEFCLSQFIEVMKAMGKVAFQSLLTGNFLFRKSDILIAVGAEAFNYGLLIGHEDSHRLLRDETADIFVTFAHRSIQEFLGAFFFVLSLNEGQSIESLLGAECTKPIFMMNPLFFHFCTWFIFSSREIFHFEILRLALETMKCSVLKLINFSQLDVINIARLYPAIDVVQAYNKSETSNIKFFRELVCACDRVRNIALESKECVQWMLDSVCHIPKSVSIISFGTSQYDIPYRRSIDKSFVIDLSVFEASDKDTLKCVRDIVLKLGNRGTIRIFWFQNLDTTICNHFLKQQVQELHIVGPDINRYLQSLPHIDCCPSLTHLSLSGISPAAQVCLTKTLEEGNLCNLTNLCIMDSDLRDNQVVNAVSMCSTLRCLNLSYSKLSTSGCQAISMLSDILTSLMFTADGLPHQEIVSSFLQRSWPNLTNFSFHGTRKYLYQFYDTLFRRGCGIHRQQSNKNVMDIINVINPNIMPLVSQILLTGCIASESYLHSMKEKIVKWKILNLDISHSWGIAGKLYILFSQTLPYLNTLILSDCGLNPQDGSSLARASMEGKLPELKHLDISENSNVDLRGLFGRGCTWSQLESLSISLVDEMSDYEWLAGRVKSGCLNSVQQLRLWTTDADIFTCKTTWVNLQKIEIFRLHHPENVRTVTSHLADAYEKGHLPALSTVCIMTSFPGMVESMAEELDGLRKHNVDVHTGRIDENMFLSKFGILQ